MLGCLGVVCHVTPAQNDDDMALCSLSRPHLSASLPLVDFDRMGQVALTGAFAGLDLFDDSTPTSFDPSVSSLLSRTPQGAL